MNNNQYSIYLKKLQLQNCTISFTQSNYLITIVLKIAPRVQTTLIYNIYQPQCAPNYLYLQNTRKKKPAFLRSGFTKVNTKTYHERKNWEGIFTKTKLCLLSLPKQRLSQLKPIKELYLYQGMRKGKSKTTAETIVSAKKFMKFLAKFVLFAL